MKRNSVITEKVKALRIVPDSEDPYVRKDLMGDFDYSAQFTVQLFTRTPGASIFYCLEKEGAEGAAFLPYDPTAGIFLTPPPFGAEEPTTAKYRLRAYAVCPGMQNSDILERRYTIRRKPWKQTVVAPLLTSGGLEVENAYRIKDYANDNMFLFNGEKAALLYDTGFFAKGGDLRKEVIDIVGTRKPLWVVMSHNGPDHIQMTWQFVGKPNTEIYINDRDRYMLEQHVREQLGLPDTEETAAYLRQTIHNLREGDCFDLGNWKFRAMEVPGHTFGCVALVDSLQGDVLMGDCIGINPYSRPGALWMWNIVPRVPLNDYLSILRIFTDKLRRYHPKEIYGGHYDRAMSGEHIFTYLDNLRIAVEKLIDYGLPATEIASGYPPQEYVAKSLVGDRFTNPYYAGIVTSTDLMFEPEYLDGKEEKNADLCYLRVSLPGSEENLLVTQEDSGLGISLNFVYHDISPSPEETLAKSRTRISRPCYRVKVPSGTEKVHITPVTGSHYSELYINGKRAASDYIYEAYLNSSSCTKVELKVLSEDKSIERFYDLEIHLISERQ